ncbi:MAG: ABC transporter substrate-binding protein [Pseudolabrys sp.]
MLFNRFGAFVAALTLGGALVSASAQAQSKLGEISVSVVPSTSAVVLYVARDGGYFAKEGLDVKITEFASGAESERAMASGAVDMGGGGLGTTLIMANQGIKAKNVALFQSKSIFTLVASNKLDAKPGDIKALRGKNIGISSPGSLTDLFLRIALRDAGLDPDRDVTIIATGGLNAHLPALQAGRIDAQMTWEPATVTITKGEKAGKILLDLRTNDVPASLNLLGSSLQATDKWLAAPGNLEKAKAAARAIVAARKAIAADPNVMIEPLHKIFPKLSNDLLKDIASVEAASYTGTITKEAVDHMNKVYRAAGITKTDVSYKDVVDPRLAAEWK